MKLISAAAHELISNMRNFFERDNAIPSFTNEEPLRAELFNAEKMESFGKLLAGTHTLSTKPAKDHLLERLADNETILRETHKLLTD